MGTRHLIAVHLDGQYRIAQYGQWDGDPRGHGVDVLEFLREHNDDQFRAAVRQTRFISDAEYNAIWAEFGVAADPVSVSWEVGAARDKAYPSLSRDTGARILPLVRAKPTVPLRDHIGFAGDSLCEYAYVIDIDRNSFEVYRGFNRTPLTEGERFASFAEQRPLNPDAERYYPVRLWRQWALSDLPSEEEFLRALTEDDE